ncbi:hypothetical protein CYMTET_38978 [Cymbomonas tetramitiformis]|uniref:Uncharacterized protein n=1 Tax=Cymbomonas tetramitiformis TaxID=36881 RepID=A0AAE0F4E1_9CHLO|nr:hypothetical protein CYMTET_38978 [Cymbomonas tetramitiformis]
MKWFWLPGNRFVEIVSFVTLLAILLFLVIKEAVALADQSGDRKTLLVNEILSTEYELARVIEEEGSSSSVGSKKYKKQLESAASLLAKSQLLLNHMEHAVYPITIMGIEMGIGALGSTIGLAIAGISWGAVVYLEQSHEAGYAYNFNADGRYTDE